MVRQRTLTPSFGGSNPPSPGIKKALSERDRKVLFYVSSLVRNEKMDDNISNLNHFRKDGLEYEPNGFRAGHA